MGSPVYAVLCMASTIGQGENETTISSWTIQTAKIYSQSTTTPTITGQTLILGGIALAKTKTVTPAALKLKTCAKEIRVAGVVQKCGREYLGDDRNCPNAKAGVHLNKYPTGFCQAGSHEGQKNLSPSGKVLKPCDQFVTCPCKCHADLDKLFALTDRPRVFVDSSGYQTPPREFWMPSDDPDYRSSMDGLPDTPRNDEEPPTVAELAPVAPTYQPTPTGRAARGELESWVHDAFMIWLVEQDGDFTPAYVSREIARTQAVESSVGAIDAVFKRWEKLRFATMAKKPTRLTGITEDGQNIGLWKMKDRAKRDEQRRRADLRRGIR